MGTALEKKVQSLEAKIMLLETRLEAAGVPTERWLSPQKVADLLNTSRTRVMEEIRMAEYGRHNGIKTDLQYGKHYRKDRSEWKVCDRAYRQIVLDTPPELRSEIDVPKEFKL